MTKRVLVLTALLAIVTGLFAQHKPEFSLRIHPIRDTFAVRETITLEVTTTNLTEVGNAIHLYSEARRGASHED
jgi:hypothetical protein